MKSLISVLILLTFSAALNSTETYYNAYDPHEPLAFRFTIFKSELAEKAFPVFEKTLIIPDLITVVESTEYITYKIIREHRLSSYALIAEMEMDRKFDLAHYHEITFAGKPKTPFVVESEPDSSKNVPVDALLLYKRSMWLEALRVLDLEYKIKDEETSPAYKFNAFNVEFDTVGNFMYAKLKIYIPRRNVADEMLTRLSKTESQLSTIEVDLKDFKKFTTSKVTTIDKTTIKNSNRVAEIAGMIQSIQSSLARVKSELSTIKSKVK